MLLQKSIKERFLHALGFEVLALVICAPLFDRAQRRIGFKRTVGARVVHSLLFEVGLIVAVVPLAAWWLDIGLWPALVLDIGIVLFFLPYTFAYNWVYDHLRARVVARRMRLAAGCAR